MNILVIMQGASGSGKSTLAKQIGYVLSAYNEVVICSTDDFFIVDGVYKFDPTKLGFNHKRNLDKAITAMSEGKTVIVDNTNLNRWQCRPYVEYAVNNNIPVRFVRATGNFQNTHGVPPEKVEQMKSQLEDLTIENVLASKSPFQK